MENPKDSKKGRRSINPPYVRIAVSVCAVALLVVHKLYPGALPDDRIGIGLIVVGLLPWLLAVVSEAELPAVCQQNAAQESSAHICFAFARAQWGVTPLTDFMVVREIVCFSVAGESGP